MENRTHKDVESNKTRRQFSIQQVVLISVTIFTAAVLLTWSLTRSEHNWTPDDKIAFLNSCKSGNQSDSGDLILTNTELNTYCECIFDEMTKLYPEGPSLQFPDSSTAGVMINSCMDTAKN